MSTNAKATGFLELNINGFDQAIKTAKNLMMGLAATFGAYKLGEFFKDGIKDAIDFGKEMQSASKAMGGFDPGSLLLAQKALEKTGMGAEEARGHLGDFIRDGRQISEMFGGSENYAKALKSASADYGSQASILTRSAEKLQSVWNTMESIGSKLRTFFMAMVENFVLPLQTALDYLNETDLSGVGASFGKAIGDAATTLMGVFKNGDTIKVLGSGIKWAFLSGVDLLITGFAKAATFLSVAFVEIANSFHKSLLLDQIGDALKDIFRGLGAILSSAILGASGKMADAIGAKDTAKALGVNSEWEMHRAGNNFSDAQRQFGKMDLGRGVDDTASAIKAGAEAASKIHLGDSGAGKAAKEVWEGMKGALDKGTATGTQMEADSRAKHAKDEALAKNTLSTFSGSSSKVIADSLAKVGGGGNYIIAGQSLAQKDHALRVRATKATEESKTALDKVAKNTEPRNKPDTLGR